MNEELKNEYFKLCQDYKNLEKKLQSEYYELGKVIHDITDKRVQNINQLVEEMIIIKTRIKQLNEVEIEKGDTL